MSDQLQIGTAVEINNLFIWNDPHGHPTPPTSPQFRSDTSFAGRCARLGLAKIQPKIQLCAGGYGWPKYSSNQPEGSPLAAKSSTHSRVSMEFNPMYSSNKSWSFWRYLMKLWWKGGSDGGKCTCQYMKVQQQQHFPPGLICNCGSASLRGALNCAF